MRILFAALLAGTSTLSISLGQGWLFQRPTPIAYGASTNVTRNWSVHPEIQRRCSAIGNAGQARYSWRHIRDCTRKALVRVSVKTNKSQRQARSRDATLPKRNARTRHARTESVCVVSGQSCAQLLLHLLNQQRALHGVAPLQYDALASLGTTGCPGAYGHSIHMAQEGAISHDQFPRDICGRYTIAGQNVGVSNGFFAWQGIQNINAGMLAEPWKPGCFDNHHCNIDNPAFHRVGIGIHVAGATTWITEDFLG